MTLFFVFRPMFWKKKFLERENRQASTKFLKNGHFLPLHYTSILFDDVKKSGFEYYK